MNVNDVNRGIRKFKKGRRVGRGIGSGRGKTCGRGHKGQKSNPGYAALPIFQGGTMPLVRRIPKRGFTNSFALSVACVNVGDLERVFAAGDEITPDTLRQKSVLKGRFDLVKILGDGELTKSLKVSADRFSQTARDKIEKAGGQIVLLPGKTTVAQKNKQKRHKSQADKSAS